MVEHREPGVVVQRMLVVELEDRLLFPRWIVERTFAWLARCRRHSKDYERTAQSSEAMVQLSMISLMSRRLAKAKPI